MTPTEPHGPRYLVEPGLRPDHRPQAAMDYWQAFSRKLRYPLGPRRKAVAFLERVLDPDHAISAVGSDGEFLGVAGFKSPQGAFVGGGIRDMIEVYGWIGGLARSLLVATLERECEGGVLLMDGIFVRNAARGLGIGTALLAAVEQRAADCGLQQVRLDVIDTNPRARALYERLGFRETSTVSMGVLGHIFGFESATTMTKEARDAGCERP